MFKVKGWLPMGLLKGSLTYIGQLTKREFNY